MLEKVQADRQRKLQQIRELGIDPYGCRYDSAEAVAPIRTRFEQAEQQAKAEGGEEAAPEGLQGDAAGRIVLWRDMGKMVFAHIRDQSGQIQIALRKNELDETTWQLVKLLDLGDIIAVAGRLQRTRTGEVTIWASRLTLLTKSLLPMPEKFHGLTDTETRYRQRYLDLMTNPESMANFQKRVAIMECFRDVLRNRGFIEVETPVLQPIYGGAAARPFTTHHNTLDMDLFLRISPELYLKRLLVGGMEKVYEFARNFRNEGIDTRHNPEFTMMELYQAYADYEVMMDITEEMLATAAERVIGSTTVNYGEHELNFARPWRRATYEDLLQEHAGVSMRDPAAVRAKAKELGLDPENKDDAVVVNDVFEETVEEHLIQPTFVMDYPAELCPLTRRKSDDPSLALRFECFIAGMELANAYTELNDPAVQEENFRAQVRGEAEGETMRVMDEDFLTALAHGMPPAGGLGMGLDRAIMLLTGTTSIRDVVLFPQLRSIVRTEQAPDEGETQDVE
jgi:lysyl-tRNA synthetase class 2